MWTIKKISININHLTIILLTLAIMITSTLTTLTISAKLASCLNPLVYAVSHPKFREAMAREFPGCGIGEKPKDVDSTTVAVTTA